jgi:exosortase
MATAARTALLSLLFVFAYAPILFDLVQGLPGNRLVQHAPFVFALAGYLAFERRHELVRLAHEQDAGGTALVFLAGVVLNVIGQALGISCVAQVSLPITLYGLILYLMGSSAARILLFPVMLLVLAFPIPGKLYLDLVVPLKLFVSRGAAWLLREAGYDVVRRGNVLIVDSLTIGVTDACAGLSSLMTILALSVFHGYLRIRRFGLRLFVVLAGLLLVLAANILRVTALSAVAVRWGPESAFGGTHALWGVLVFAACVLGLLTVTACVSRFEARMIR